MAHSHVMHGCYARQHVTEIAHQESIPTQSLGGVFGTDAEIHVHWRTWYIGCMKYCYSCSRLAKLLGLELVNE